MDTYINVEPCGFFRGETGLNYTKVIHELNCDEIDPIVGNADGDELESVEIEGGIDDREAGRGFRHGRIPADPAFPSQNFIGCGFRTKGILIPVTLDLHGNICTGKNFATGRCKVPGTGRPYSNTFVLYYNNAGKFVLARNCQRRSDFA